MRLLSLDDTRDYRLLIAGDGPKTLSLKKHLERHAQGKFKFLGHITDKEKLANLYANADVFIHPNGREPFGIAPLEAMASGTPVVAPNSGGILTYANDDNMWLANPNGVEFAAAVQNVFADERRTKEKVANALETARQYTWERSTDRLFALYDKMYEDFCQRNELYAYKTEPKEINFVAELLTE
jgi:alpha-1,6-mannosyltransferase